MTSRLQHGDQIKTKPEPFQEPPTAHSPGPYVQSNGPTDLTQIHGGNRSKLTQPAAVLVDGKRINGKTNNKARI